MAAKTGTVRPRPQSGDGYIVHKVSFADIDNGDTWTSTLAGKIQYVGCLQEGQSTKFTASSQVVTFATSADNLALDLMVVTR